MKTNGAHNSAAETDYHTPHYQSCHAETGHHRKDTVGETSPINIKL